MYPPIALTVFIVGAIVAILASRPRLADGMIADLGEWSSITGLFFWLWSVAK